MSLGIALFASVVLVLAVYNPKFRKVLFWFVGVSAGLAVVIGAGVYVYSWYTNPWRVVKQTPTKLAIVEIHGGETLKIIQPAPVPNSQIDLSAGTIPMIYGGHKQKFVIVCGDFGEPGKLIAAEDQNGTITCD
jgi:hypothetical protein